MYLDDYGQLQVFLSFSACQDKACTDIAISDDIIAEYEESFTISLERTPDLDSRISLSAESGIINIMDDDGMLFEYFLLLIEFHKQVWWLVLAP